MRRLFVIACTAVTLAACGKKEAAENGSVAENLTLESVQANDASALEAVQSESANLTITGGKEETGNAAESNAGSNAVAGSNADADANAE